MNDAWLTAIEGRPRMIPWDDRYLFGWKAKTPSGQAGVDVDVLLRIYKKLG